MGKLINLICLAQNALEGFRNVVCNIKRVERSWYSRRFTARISWKLCNTRWHV